MAFIIPMLGRSSRFFDEAYVLPKYQLEINGISAFSLSLSSFKRYFRTDLFIFIVRSDYGASEFVQSELKKSRIINFIIKKIDYETKGQAETVSLSLNLIKEDEPIYIFNIDTYREDYTKPNFVNKCDGYLEVFNGEGDAWSFVFPGENNKVLKTTEKVRISNLCSNGLYFFKNKETFTDAINNAKNNHKMEKGEYYVAPLYNELIDKGMDVRYKLTDIEKMKFFGTPKEYKKLIKK